MFGAERCGFVVATLLPTLFGLGVELGCRTELGCGTTAMTFVDAYSSTRVLAYSEYDGYSSND